MKQWKSAPAMQIDPKKQYKATIETARGNIVIELAPQYAPKTVNNFVFLAKEGYYDGILFHRVISDFMIQGGDPTGTGRGGPGYKFEDETKGNPLKHETGVLSMANSGPNTNGSQFFLVYKDTTLGPNYTIWGRIVSGLEIVKYIAEGGVKDGSTDGTPLRTISIDKASAGS